MLKFHHLILLSIMLLIAGNIYSQTQDEAYLKLVDAIQYTKNKQYAEAIPRYLRALELNEAKYGPSAYEGLALCYKQTGKPDEALTYYTKAINAKPTHSAYFSRGLIYKEKGNKQAAANDIAKAVELAPDKVDYRPHLANLYQDLGNIQGATTHLRYYVDHVPANTPNLASYYRSLGSLYEKSKQYAQSVWAYEKYLESNPKDGRVLFILGYMYYKNLNNADKGVLYFNKALEVGPTKEDKITIYDNLGKIYYDKGQFAQAIANYKEELKLVTGDEVAKVQFKLAVTYHRAKQYKEAIDAYQAAIKGKHKEDICYDSIANCYLSMQNYSAGIPFAQQAVKLNPKEAKYGLTLAQLYEHLGSQIGDGAEAIKNFKEAIKVFESIKNDPKTSQYAREHIGFCSKRIFEIKEAAYGTNFNTASKEDLMKVTGITPALANNIITYRQKNGDFKKKEDLLNVPGMTPELFEKIKGEVDVSIVPDVSIVTEKNSIELEVGTKNSFELSFERPSSENDTYYIGVIGLPQNIIAQFTEGEKPDNLNQIKFGYDEADKKIKLTLAIPSKVDPQMIDKPIKFFAVGMIPKDYNNLKGIPADTSKLVGTKAGKTMLTVTPVSGGKATISTTEDYFETKTGKKLKIPVKVKNVGTKKLEGFKLGAKTPPNWKVSCEPQSANIDLKAEQTFTLILVSDRKTKTGDYNVRIKGEATADGYTVKTKDLPIRVHSTQTSIIPLLAGIVVVLLILALIILPKLKPKAKA